GECRMKGELLQAEASSESGRQDAELGRIQMATNPCTAQLLGSQGRLQKIEGETEARLFLFVLINVY
ncbi:hypothetical protein ACQP3C_27705, partial [Escherichia coli]